MDPPKRMCALMVTSVGLAFAGIRAYVLGPYAWHLAVLVFILSLAPVVINYVGPRNGSRDNRKLISHGYLQVILGYTVPYISPAYGCEATDPITDAVHRE